MSKLSFVIYLGKDKSIPEVSKIGGIPIVELSIEFNDSQTSRCYLFTNGNRIKRVFRNFLNNTLDRFSYFISNCDRISEII